MIIHDFVPVKVYAPFPVVSEYTFGNEKDTLLLLPANDTSMSPGYPPRIKGVLGEEVLRDETVAFDWRG